MKTIVNEPLPRDPVAVPLSRQLLAPLIEHLTAHEQMTVKLLTSELVANEICHGTSDSPPLLRVEEHDGFLRVLVVADGAPFTPTVSPPSSERTGGRGLLIISRLSEAFGVRRQGKRRAAWFDLICSRV